MQNFYELLGIEQDASAAEIKKAFREKAKRLHPDIAGKAAEDRMRKLLGAYETLSSEHRRFEYDRAYARFVKNRGFDYRTWLREQGDDPVFQAKLIFFELLHMEDEEAIAQWRKSGGINFRMEKYLDREDWMDCAFILAEELDKRQHSYEAFRLLSLIVREERKKPYFRLFAPEIEKLVREIVRLRLKPQVDSETWIECLRTLLDLGFPAQDNLNWTRLLSKALLAAGDQAGAEQVAGETKKPGGFRQPRKRKEAVK